MKVIYLGLRGLVAALGIACIAYGIVVKGAGSGTLFFAVWLALGAVLLLLACFARMSLWRLLPLPLRVLLVAALAAGLALFVFTEAQIATGYQEESDPGLDYLIVLGAQVHKSGPSRVLQYRLDAACAYLEENPDTRCIVSGAQGYNEPFTEAAGMKAYLVDKGIAEERIIEEPLATSTVENILCSMAWMESPQASVGIVTNDFHMYRALRLARKAGLPQAQGLTAGSPALFRPNNMLRECLGVWKDMLYGNL